MSVFDSAIFDSAIFDTGAIAAALPEGGIGHDKRRRRPVPITYVDGSVIDYLTMGEKEEKPAPRPRRIKQAEIVAKVEESAAYIAAGRPLLMSQAAMVAEIKATPDIERLLEIDNKRVSRAIDLYVAILLKEQEEEEEEAFAMLLAA